MLCTLQKDGNISRILPHLWIKYAKNELPLQCGQCCDYSLLTDLTGVDWCHNISNGMDNLSTFQLPFITHEMYANYYCIDLLLHHISP